MKSILPGIYFLLFALASSHGQETATILPDDQQTLKGWGCCPIWIDNYDISELPLAEEAAYSMGATMIRHSQLAGVGDGEGNIVPSAADRLCRSIALTAARSLPYILSNWSPPAGMKTAEVNGSVSGSTPVYLRTDREYAFCILVARLFDYIRVTKALSLPVAYSLQNEPTCSTPWQGCIYGAEQYKRVTKLLRAALDSAGYSGVALIGPEDGGYYNGEGWNWSTGLLGGADFPSCDDAAFDGAIALFASHSYDWSPFTTIGHFNDWNDGCDARGKDRCMTEYCYIEDTENPHAVGTLRRLIADMAFLKNNYWFTWTVAGGSADYGDALCYGDGAGRLDRKQAYYALKKLFTSVPIGSKVRRMVSTDEDLVTTDAGKMDMVAFAGDTNMAAVIVNPASVQKQTDLLGFDGASAHVYQCVGEETNTDMVQAAILEVTDGLVRNLDLPANSITIIVSSGGRTSVRAPVPAGEGFSDIAVSVIRNRIILRAPMHWTGPCRFSLHDACGRRVLAGTVDLSGPAEIGVQAIRSGVYFLVLRGGHGETARKIVIQR